MSLFFREHQQGSHGSNKMNEASIIIMMGFAGFLWAVAAYTVGVKEGERKGYARGRAVGRHASSREVSE
jgi:hypothetical protein